ncbi:MAG: hypothetical protein QNJ97_26455 [Myxococcota bacterium]|nr:hypothetical protein [Myxococcota bacterium]
MTESRTKIQVTGNSTPSQESGDSREQVRQVACYRYLGPVQWNREQRASIDEETALWAARMCVGEGGRKCNKTKAAAMLWALLNRWFLHPARRHWPTFLFLMRRFSQPINPRWQRGGDLARKYAGTKYCSPARLRRRAIISSLTWDQIPKQIIETVKAFQQGVIPPPSELKDLERPRISNWASHKNLDKKYPWGISFEKARQPDWFFEDKKLIKGSVVVDHWQEPSVG